MNVLSNLAAIAAAGLLVAAASAAEPKGLPAMVTVTPEETDELLANPHMGWQTFHRTKDKDRNLPSWIPSTVHYSRWGWKEVEPEPGKLDTAFLDKVLRTTEP